MLLAEPRTLSGWLGWAEDSLAQSGVASPRHDAERLAARVLGVSWGELWARLRDPVSSEALGRLGGLLSRRLSGEPLGYVLGSVVFHGTELQCGPGVLVPRPETETLVDVALELVAGRPEPVVVDIGTGTGAVAVAVARSRPDARAWATDISEAALRYAERNVERAGVGVSLRRGDLFDALPPALRGGIDLVVSNPPYVPADAVLPADVAAEPPEALLAGPDGDDVLRRIAEARAWLRPNGALALEIGTAEQASRVVAMLVSSFEAAGIRDDHTGRPRVVWARG